MGSLPHFMSFKKKSKEDTYECLNLIGKERFDEHDIEIHDIITFKEDLLDFKKGKTYVRTSGSSYDHRNKKFLGGIKEIKFNQCSIIYDEVYWVYGRKNMEKLVEIEKVECVNGKYIPFKKSEFDIELEKTGLIERVIGGYFAKNYECNSDEVVELENRINVRNADEETYSYIYYDFDYKMLKDGDFLCLTSLYDEGIGGLRVWCYDRTTSDASGYIFLGDSEESKLEKTEENIKLVCQSIAYKLNQKGYKNINVMYRTGYKVEELDKCLEDAGLK